MKKFSARKMLVLAVSVLVLLFTAGPSYPEEPAKKEVPIRFRAELSYVNVSGNTETQTLAGKLESKREGPLNRLYLKGSVLWAANASGETSNKHDIEGRWERVLTERTFGLATAGYIRDKFSGYSFRTYIGPGIGADLVKTKKHSFQGRLSLLYFHDEFSAGEKSTDDYMASKTSLKYVWKVYENLKFSETLDYFAPLDEMGRYFVDSVASLDVRINAHLSLGMSYKVNYQNKVPSPEIKHTDRTFLTRMIVDF